MDFDPDLLTADDLGFSVPTVDSLNSALLAIEQAGGDPMQPTQIIDQTTNQVTAIVRRDASGQTMVDVPQHPTQSIAGVVQSVTGFIDKVAGTLTQIGTQIQKSGNAVRGAAAGAQTGYNAPTSLTPYLLAGVAVLGALLLTERRR